MPDLDFTNKPGWDDDRLLKEFGKKATFLGGGCYRINYFGQEIYNKCTGQLFKEWKSCFTLRDGRYYYA